VAKPEELRNHRLIVMFFDLTSMQPEDIDRSVAARSVFENEDAAGRPRGAVSQGDSLKVDQDFTADKNALINEVGVYNGTKGRGLRRAPPRIQNQVEDTTAYTPDESEYNDVNTDRELFCAAGGGAVAREDRREKIAALFFRGHLAGRD